MKVTTNIDELNNHLNSVFKGMMKSAELKSAGIDAGKVIGRYVGDNVTGSSDSGYNYEQSGGFNKLISTEGKNPEVKSGSSSMTIGVFELDNMNEGVYSRRNHQYQLHNIWDSKAHEYKNTIISLKAESQMPKWIIAEFGTKNGESPPENLKVNYTPRPDKEFLFGPSIGSVGGPGGGSKRGMFMVSEKGLGHLYGDKRNLFSYRTHHGVKAGHVFTKGLTESKEEVFDILSDGIASYLSKH